MTVQSVLTAASSLYMVLVALLLGSFVNLVADRLPRGESVVRPASFCRGCRRRLNVIDLVPVAGYVVRGGRCRTCGVSIGGSAPLVEAGSGLAMAIPLVLLGPFGGAVAGTLLVATIGGAVITIAVVRARGELRL